MLNRMIDQAVQSKTVGQKRKQNCFVKVCGTTVYGSATHSCGATLLLRLAGMLPGTLPLTVLPATLATL